MNASTSLAAVLFASPLLASAAAPAVPPHQETPMKMRLNVAGTGQPLVLMGGGLTGWLSWEPHEAKLKASRQVLRPQLLCVQAGLDGVALPKDYSVKMESAALARALDEAGAKGPLDLVAWSFGAVVTLDFAMDHPERVRTLTVIEPPAFWVLDALGDEDAASRKEREEMKALHDGMKGDVSEDQLVQFAHQAGFVPKNVDPRSVPNWPVWSKHRRSLLNGPALFAHRDTAARLRAFDRPVLVVKGTGSSHFLHRIADDLAKTLPKAKTTELPAGHAPQIVSMDAFLAKVAEFQASP